MQQSHPLQIPLNINHTLFAASSPLQYAPATVPNPPGGDVCSPANHTPRSTPIPPLYAPPNASHNPTDPTGRLVNDPRASSQGKQDRSRVAWSSTGGSHHRGLGGTQRKHPAPCPVSISPVMQRRPHWPYLDEEPDDGLGEWRWQAGVRNDLRSPLGRVGVGCAFGAERREDSTTGNGGTPRGFGLLLLLLFTIPKQHSFPSHEGPRMHWET
ncbi:uncharacterized protein GGS25DRAFT_525675 [Hypoxylon fragiforme]|uniref:uncharacterized protein n=1 Tax=Hypoxylon fragiforme TaxID=63214 RepID=UPI0020C70AF0|nr:uncharacterized protein GGS25DRAFT_525675 [Hypoxylon fragiforme]KAI2604390.1 hypothetical protein GGS25DRAFT_525675 [Hypoxylon fragiforme]